MAMVSAAVLLPLFVFLESSGPSTAFLGFSAAVFLPLFVCLSAAVLLPCMQRLVRCLGMFAVCGNSPMQPWLRPELEQPPPAPTVSPSSLSSTCRLEFAAMASLRARQGRSYRDRPAPGTEELASFFHDLMASYETISQRADLKYGTERLGPLLPDELMTRYSLLLQNLTPRDDVPTLVLNLLDEIHAGPVPDRVRMAFTPVMEYCVHTVWLNQAVPEALVQAAERFESTPHPDGLGMMPAVLVPMFFLGLLDDGVTAAQEEVEQFSWARNIMEGLDNNMQEKFFPNISPDPVMVFEGVQRFRGPEPVASSGA